MREMRDSGIEWLGKIPRHWEVMPNKRIMKKKKEICSQYQGEDILSLTMNGVIVRDLNAGGKMPTTFDGYQHLNPGNLLMCLFDIDVTPRCIGLIKNEGLSSPAYSQFVVNEKGYAPYYYYYYLNLDHTKELLHIAKNLRHSLTEDQLGEIGVAVPPYAEQIRIVDVLEERLPKVDILISNVKAQIEKLKAYRQSTITEVVTKGLAPSVQMKDSEVEWIGKIANTHTIFRLKYLLNSPMQYGANESGDKLIEDSVRYIRITDITADGKLKDDENNQYLPMAVAEDYILKDKDILFARSGGTVGKSFLYHENYGLSAYAGYLIKAECDSSSLLPEYLIYYTQSSLYELWKNMIFIQATIQNIGANKYSNMEIPVPSIEEQASIIEYLDDKCSKIDQLISIKQKKIEKLEQYKKSLIYEYVTGKKEVS